MYHSPFYIIQVMFQGDIFMMFSDRIIKYVLWVLNSLQWLTLKELLIVHFFETFPSQSLAFSFSFPDINRLFGHRFHTMKMTKYSLHPSRFLHLHSVMTVCESSWCQLCLHWWQWRLSLWQQLVLPMTKIFGIIMILGFRIYISFIHN